MAGCTLFTSLDGLSGEGDAGADASSAETGADAGPPAPTGCACPKGTTETNGVCVAEASAAGYACTAPIAAPACARTYEAELCATQTAFAYGTACGGKPRPSVFFTLGDLSGTSADGGLRKWVVKSQNTDVLGRTNAACTQAVEPCAEGSAPRGELTPGGATVVIGKVVTSGCQLVRVDIEPN